MLLRNFGFSIRRVILLFISAGSLLSPAWAQSSLPPCDTTRNISSWTNCVGSRTFPNGDKYSGEWRSGKHHGQGTFTAANGDQYAGVFKDGRRHGRGTLAFKDGRPAQEGVWENNLFLRAEIAAERITSKAKTAQSPTKDMGLQPLVDERTALINWRVLEARPFGSLQTQPHASTVFGVAFSSDGSKIVTGSSDSTAVLWEVTTGQPIKTWHHGSAVNSVAFSPDGSMVLTGSSDNTAVLREVKTGQTLQTWRHILVVNSVAFSPDGSKVLTGSRDGSAVLRDVKTGQTLQAWRHDSDVHSVAFSPGGSEVLTGSSDKTAVLRDVKTSS